ncbi:MAG: threonine--tRNA ligase [Deltaproteobacteria bacterium]|nr:threonine--tRNA ligase [Deltaproteobacteria bacterium]
MDVVTVFLSDGSQTEVEKGISLREVAKRIGRKDLDRIVAARVDGHLVDLESSLNGDASVGFVTEDSPEGLEILRHSASHVMAAAVKELFDGVKVTIGPPIEDGFYYDFDFSRGFTPQDLEAIEKKMREIIRQDVPFVRKEVDRDRAIEMFREMGEPYKVELLEEIPDKTVSLYESGGFLDLCRGPHVASSGKIRAFKLLRVSGAYWRGDERNKQLQRIYGTAFFSREELESYLKKLEEAKKRDHRILGKQLDLFSTHELAGAGLVYWHPRGALIREIIEDFWRREHRRRGYEIVYSPHLYRASLLKVSGHLQFYRESMYSPMDIDGVDYYIKPMNCPGHIMIYQNSIRSYRDLPVRYAELGTVYRYERSGTLTGMFRVRGFTQDDAHIFCTPEQLKDEILGVLNLADFMMRTFEYEYRIYLATRPDKYKGSEALWERATGSLEAALEEFGRGYDVDPGGGVFYGPKIDIKLIDALGRLWQGPTIQVDFNFPESFNIEYVGKDGNRHRVAMIHRTVLGSMERFVGGLIEHYGGAFPLWLAPVQLTVLTITDRSKTYGKEVAARLREAGFRVGEDFRNEKIGLKIREAQLQKVPYMLVIGDREVSGRSVSPRRLDGQQLEPMALDRLIDLVRSEARVPTAE